MAKLMTRLLRRLFRNEGHWEDLAFFRGISIFHSMTSGQIGRIMQDMQIRSYHAGEVLFQEGQVGRAVFIIRSGSVALERTLPGGAIQRLGTLGPGQIFGEMALLENRPRTARATVLEDGDIYLLYSATLETLMKHNPRIGLKLMKNLAVLLSALLRKTTQAAGATKVEGSRP